MQVMTDCKSKEEFIQKMGERGWKVTWKDSRKNITFENKQGQKVRDKKLSALFNLDVSKEAILDECDRQAAGTDKETIDPEFEQYYREVEEVIGQCTGGHSEAAKRESKSKTGKVSVKEQLRENQARVDATKTENKAKRTPE